MKVRVQGEVYESPEEARAAADELEARLEDLPEYGPQRRQVRAHVDALRGAARKLEAKAAKQTPQPKNRPKAKPARRKLAKKAWGNRRAPAAPRLRGGLSGRVLRETGYTRATTSTSRFLMQVFGIVVALALVIVLLEAEERGAEGRRPFSGLAYALVDLVGRWVGMVDPVTGRGLSGAPEPGWGRPAREPGQPTVTPVRV